MDRSIHSFITLDALKLQQSSSPPLPLHEQLFIFGLNSPHALAAIYIKIYALFNHNFAVVVVSFSVADYFFACFKRITVRKEWKKERKTNLMI